MQLIQKRTYFFICSILFLLIFIVPVVFAIQKPDSAANKIQKPSDYLVATYFHNTFRCPTCYKIEKLSAQAIRSNFADELKNKTLVWRVINVDKPENQHYNKDYQLYTKSLIISEVKNGKQIRWKNLEKIWTYVGNDQDFEKYVTSEIKDWMKK